MATKSEYLVGFEEIADSGRNTAATLQKTGIITVPAKMVNGKSYKVLFNKSTSQIALVPHAGPNAIKIAGSLRYINARHLLRLADVALPDKAMRLKTATMSDGTIIINLLS
jgi:hypothetical protein